MTIRKSEVVFFGGKSLEALRLFNATLVNWGGLSPDVVRDARAIGVRYFAGAAFRTAFRGMIDYTPNFMDAVCRWPKLWLAIRWN